MDAGKALIGSLEIIKLLYETAETYRRLEKINKNILSELALLITIKDQILNSRRMENNPIIDNYLVNINEKLIKFKNLVDNVEKQNFLGKILYVKKIEKISKYINQAIRKLKFILDLKRDMHESSKQDVANIISDPLALQFWENNFGSDHIFIQTSLFFSSLRMNTNLLSSEIEFLKRVINDNNDKNITAFEIQEWIDFFGDFSVAIKRTIDSLFDPNTYDIVDWYQKNISKSIVLSVLETRKFLIRKHSTQKGVFIINFKNGDELCNLYIRNKDNNFILEKISNMTPHEILIYQSIDLKKSTNLKDFAILLQNIIDPNNSKFQNWEEERKKDIDQTIPDSFFELPKIPSIDDIKNNIENVVEKSVSNFFSIFSCKKIK